MLCWKLGLKIPEKVILSFSPTRNYCNLLEAFSSILNMLILFVYLLMDIHTITIKKQNETK